MSTENNNLYEISINILRNLIAFKTISGEDNNQIIDYCDQILKKTGANSFRTYDKEKKELIFFLLLKQKKNLIKHL